MNEFFMSHHPIRRMKSFKYAFQGFYHALKHEANFRIQFVFFLVCIGMGIGFNITKIEWLFLIITNGLLLASELLNTLVEEFIDHLIKEHHEGARVIKDLAAAYVLMNALVTLFVFFVIFLDKLSFY